MLTTTTRFPVRLWRESYSAGGRAPKRAATGRLAKGWATVGVAALCCMMVLLVGGTGARADASPVAWSTVSAAETHTCGVRTDGTLACWGADFFGKTAPPDESAPVITLLTPPDGAEYPLHYPVLAEYFCTDAEGAGIATCEGDVPTGEPIDTSQPGPHAFTVLATDQAGNTTTVTHYYEVVAPDTDADGIPDGVDNCLTTPNLDQADLDHTDIEIAERLNQEGYRSGQGSAFTASKVDWLRYAYGIKSGCPLGPAACPRKNLPGILAPVNAPCKTGNSAVGVHQAQPVPCSWSLTVNPRPCAVLYQLERPTRAFAVPSRRLGAIRPAPRAYLWATVVVREGGNNPPYGGIGHAD
jgi:hypothetical protein